MFNAGKIRMRRAQRGVLTTVISAAVSLQLIFSGLAVAAEQPSKPRPVQQLVDGARKEGQVNLFLVTSLTDHGAKELNQAFNKRFGLNVKFNSTLGDASRQFSQTVQELKMGLPSSFDGMYVSETFVFQMLAEGGVERVEGWEELLKEILPEGYPVRDKVSPLDLNGYAFAWGTRAKVMNYNTDLIAGKTCEKPASKWAMRNMPACTSCRRLSRMPSTGFSCTPRTSGSRWCAPGVSRSRRFLPTMPACKECSWANSSLPRVTTTTCLNTKAEIRDPPRLAF